jgi:hypothetical protein
MRPLHTKASWLLAAVFSTASVAFAADKAAKPGSEENPNPKQKIEPTKGGGSEADLLARIDSLERQLRDLQSFIKQQHMEKKGEFTKGDGQKPGAEKFVEKGPPKEFPEGKKPGAEKFVEKGAPKEAPEGKKPGPDKFVEKGGPDTGKKFSSEKPDSNVKGKGEGKGEQHVGKGEAQVVRGPNGELMVPLSSLPADLQDQIMARAKNSKQEGQKGEGKGEFKSPKKGE